MPETTVVRKAAMQAEMLAADGKVPVAVEYKSPQERANATLTPNVISGIAAVVIALVPGTLAFLQAGDFGEKALQAFGISIVTAALMLVFNWAQKLRAATNDDPSNYPAPYATEPILDRQHMEAERTLPTRDGGIN